MSRNLTEANATAILNYGEDMIAIWAAKDGNPLWLNYSAGEKCRFCLIETMTWSATLWELANNIRNGWTASKWPADWGDWKRHAQT